MALAVAQGAAVQPLGEALATLGRDYGNSAAFEAVTQFLREHWATPMVVCAGYLAMVYATRSTLSKHRFLGTVDGCFAAWNLGLSLFSAWGFWQMIRPMLRNVAAKGLHYTVCGPSPEIVEGFTDEPAALALCLFCLSKIPELLDTVFLILKCKKVRFLQWYHHATVMLFCWLALATQYTAGWWFAVTNYGVHAIMYMYFFLMTFPGAAKLCKRVGPLITVVQISQMVWGLIVNGIVVREYFTTGDCHASGVTVYSAIVMYASYLVLFGQLFVEGQAKGRKGAAQGERPAPQHAKTN